MEVYVSLFSLSAMVPNSAPANYPLFIPNKMLLLLQTCKGEFFQRPSGSLLLKEKSKLNVLL